MHGFQPVGQARVINLRAFPPEFRLQGALDMDMPKLQVDVGDVRGEIAAHVRRTHVQANQPAIFASRLDYHRCSPFATDEAVVRAAPK